MHNSRTQCLFLPGFHYGAAETCRSSPVSPGKKMSGEKKEGEKKEGRVSESHNNTGTKQRGLERLNK